MKVKFYTLGCKVNQYETQGMREALEKEGMMLIHSDQKESDHQPMNDTLRNHERVHFVVINTCTVTAEADKESRYLIRRAKREFPDAKIFVTGCAIERNLEAYKQLAETDFVFGNRAKAGIAKYLRAYAGKNERDISKRSIASENEKLLSCEAIPLSVSRSVGRTRAFVKVQDGCNHACSYCNVVLARGRSQSRPLFDIIEEVTRLRDNGYREIVLVGIQLGAYGVDTRQKGIKIYLEDVLQACSKVEGIDRLRVSSIEPMDVKPSLIQAIRDIPQCCPHLHIPLQSGSDEILKRMNRRYRGAFYVDLVNQLKSDIPLFALTLDVIAGFPGETEKQHIETIEILKRVAPVKCHVFPYSRREGTKAAEMEGLSPSVIRNRALGIRKVADALGLKERSAYLGKVMPVLVESSKDGNRGLHQDRESPVFLQGFTAHYLKVGFYGERSWIGKIVQVKLNSVQDQYLLGQSLR